MDTADSSQFPARGMPSSRRAAMQPSDLPVPSPHALPARDRPDAPDSQIAVPASVLRHGRSITGSVMAEVRTFHDIPAYQRLVASGHMLADQLVTSSWPLDEVNAALSNAAARHGIRA